MLTKSSTCPKQFTELTVILTTTLLFLLTEEKTESQNNEVTVTKPFRGVQPAVRGPHAAQDGYERGPIQNCKFT